MAFLNLLIPQTAEHLRLLDTLLHAAHLGLITFALLGWLPRRLLPFHLFFIVVIWTSWIGLGLYVGHLGYCVLTDWQWRVKWALGERHLPGSYIEYLLRSLWPEDIDDALVSNVTAAVFAAVTIASMVRFRGFSHLSGFPVAVAWLITPWAVHSTLAASGQSASGFLADADHAGACLMLPAALSSGARATAESASRL